MSKPAEKIPGKDDAKTTAVVCFGWWFWLRMVWIVSESSAHSSRERALAGFRFIRTRATLPLSSGGYSVVTQDNDVEAEVENDSNDAANGERSRIGLIVDARYRTSTNIGFLPTDSSLFFPTSTEACIFFKNEIEIQLSS
mmetsp:Transcript_8893/g.26410  ORF Transcript_8893/g.26410 Transcript_8893/m.26410 type:complete len:140 (-) Transcript_8893:150-569(-)